MLASLIHGHDKVWGGFYRSDATFIEDVHERSVVEMCNRGWFGHQTPLTLAPKPLTIWDTLYRLNSTQSLSERVSKDRWHLWLRWQGEYKGRIPFAQLSLPAQLDYHLHRQRYLQQGGCLHDGPFEDINGKRVLCLLCKHYARPRIGGEWTFIEKGKRSVYRPDEE
jgi:hypothetical protein